AFPTWLAPEQVRIVTVANRFDEYGQKLARELRDELVRVHFDISSETMGKKIRAAAGQKAPNTLILGAQEQPAGTVTLRRQGEKEQATMPWAEVKGRRLEAIRTRATRV